MKLSMPRFDLMVGDAVLGPQAVVAQYAQCRKTSMPQQATIVGPFATVLAS